MKKYSRFLLPLIWMIVIFTFSQQPDLPSLTTDIRDFLFKKGAHFTEYAILVFLWFRAFRFRRLDIAIFISLAYAFSDEIHQLYIPGRTGTLRDVAIDFAGIIAGSFITIQILKRWKPSSPRAGKKLSK